MEFKVESVITTTDEGLEKILNDAVPTMEQKGYKIVSIMFIGNNCKCERIYQIVLARE